MATTHAAATPPPPPPPPPPSPSPRPTWWHALLNYIKAHPELPHILLSYTAFGQQVLRLQCAVVLAVYVAWNHVCTTGANGTPGLQEVTAQAQDLVTQCARDFVKHGCTAQQQRPGLDAACAAWQQCMSIDAHVLGAANARCGGGGGLRQLAAALSDSIDAVSTRAWMIVGFVFVVERLAVPFVCAHAAVRQQRGRPW